MLESLLAMKRAELGAIQAATTAIDETGCLAEVPALLKELARLSNSTALQALHPLPV